MAEHLDPEARARFFADMKRGAFKDYLERTGVNDAIADALRALQDVEPKPERPMEFIRSQLLIRCGLPDPLVAIKEAQARIEELEKKKAARVKKNAARIQKKRRAEEVIDLTVDEAECSKN